MCKCTVRLNFNKDTLKQMSEKTHAPVGLSPVKIGGNIPISMKKIRVGSAQVIYCRAGHSSAEDSQRLVQYVLNQADRFSSLKTSVVLQRLRKSFEDMKKGNSGVFSFYVGMKEMVEN